MSQERLNLQELEQKQFDIYDKKRISKEWEVLLPELTAVTTDALGKTPEDMNEVAGSFELLITVKELNRIIGYGGYSVDNITGIGKIVSENKMVQKDAQGKGYGAKITRMALTVHPDARYLTFSSQNPHEIQSVRRALPDAIFAPFDIAYSESLEFQSDLAKIFEHRGETDINFETGIRKGIYFGEKFGDYQINLANPGIAQIEEKLASIGLDRHAGDGIFVMARLQSPQH